MKLLKFSASWCQPCKIMSALLATATVPFEVEEIDVDANSDAAGAHKIRGVPTIIAVNGDGIEVDRLVGAVTKQALDNWLVATSTKI